MTITATTVERRQEAEQRLHELPLLAPGDRLALMLGLRLLLWEERHEARRAQRGTRTEATRRSRGRRGADAAAGATFERRNWAGPTW